MDDLQRELVGLEAKVSNKGVVDELSTVRAQLARGGDRSPPFKLANVRVGSPCKERWADMIGDDRVRVCNGCERPVFNLSEMTRAEAEAVMATRGITPCVRFYRRADGTVMTTDCPTGARRSRRLAVIAGTTTALLGASPAMADPVAPPEDAATAPAPATDDDAAAAAPTTIHIDQDIIMGIPAPGTDDIEVFQGDMIVESTPPHPPIQWSTWIRGGYGIAMQPPSVAARAIMQPAAESAVTLEGALGADVSVSVASHGDLRLGAWAEARTTSEPVLGGELILEGLPPHPYSSDIGGSGGFVLRAGGNAQVITGAIGFGYVGSMPRTDPWISWARHEIGVRVVASMTRSVDDPRDWSATVGLELDPIGALAYIYKSVTD
jgi:hypothetical protein